LTWTNRGEALQPLDRAQVSDQIACILAAEAKCRHVRMAAHQAFAQPVREAIEINATAEFAKRGRSGMRARSALVDRMTGRAHPFGQCVTLALALGRRFFSANGRGAEQGRQDQDGQGYPVCHVRRSLLAMKERYSLPLEDLLQLT